jgi:ESAT-6 family protein
MPSPFAVDTELLQDVVDRMAAFETCLEQQLADVEARVSRLHVAWSGDAAAEHLRAHREWLAGARQMREALATLRAIGATAHANYTAAVAANRQMWA